ncbi:TadE/TadG family type IV pilus assembly protein [Methylorubrum extorquens]
MSAFSKPRRISLVSRMLVRFRSEAEGVVVVEFALVAMPFLMLVAAIFECCLVCLGQLTLDTAMDRATRAVFTGTFQEASDGTDPSERMQKDMCAGYVLFNCADLKVEVTTAASFADSGARDPYDPEERRMKKDFGSRFDCPGGNNIVTVRAAATISRFFPFLDLTRRPVGRDRQLIMSTAVFKAEPYADGRCQ